MKIRTILICAALLALLCPAGPARAKVLVRTTTDYYWVEGYGMAEVAAKHRAHVKANHQGGYTAYAKPDVRCRYEIVNDGGGLCSVNNVRIRLTIHYMYPKLRRKQPTSDRKRWEAYLAGLEEHEQIHGDIAEDGAREMEEALEALRAMDCGRIRARADAVIHEVWDATNQRQNEYDDITDHGIHQNRFQGL